MRDLVGMESGEGSGADKRLEATFGVSRRVGDGGGGRVSRLERRMLPMVCELGVTHSANNMVAYHRGTARGGEGSGSEQEKKRVETAI